MGNTFKDYWIEYRNVRNFGVAEDNAVWEVKFNNDPAEGGISCYDLNLKSLGKTRTPEFSF